MLEFYWVKKINKYLHHQLINLYHAVINTDNTIGYAAPLNAYEEKKMISTLRADIRNRIKFLLIIKDKLTGIVIASVILHRNKDANSSHIADLQKGMIHPEFRGGVLFKRMFYEVLLYCKQLKIDVLTLDVRKNTRSEKLFRHLNFEVYGEMKDYARVGNHHYSGFFMQQTVNHLLLNNYKGDTTYVKSN